MDVLANSEFWTRYTKSKPDLPRFVVVADAIARQVVESGARDGTPLPGCRQISMACGHTIQTVQNAFQRLISLDIITMLPGRPAQVKSYHSAREHLGTQAQAAFSESIALQLLCGTNVDELVATTRALAVANG